jgi:diacylglycerol kinase family enzyme
MPTRTGILKVLPMTMKPGPGNYVEHPAVEEAHSPWLTVRMQPSSPAHADGELFNLASTELAYRVHPGALQLLTNA